jgi:S-(2-succino)cysteine N-acetyltransferase
MQARIESVCWRRLNESDLAEWLNLLHRAYAANYAAGMNFTAATISAEEGRNVMQTANVYGGYIDEHLVSTFTLRSDEEGVHLNFLAVDPTLQRNGLGRVAVHTAERYAKNMGATALLLDTAEVHPWLLSYYEKLGYERYGIAQWPGKTYRSVLYRKVLTRTYP